MKIIFDHQIFDFVYGGASKYFVKLLQHLPQDCWATTCLCSPNNYVRDLKLFSPTCKQHFRGQTVLMERMNRPFTHLRLQWGNYDIYHQTNFDTRFLADTNGKPIVTTYHDANLSTIDPHPEIVKMQAESLRRADAIVAVSENTKKDLLRLFDNVDEKKVKVIYHGIDQVDLSRLNPSRIIAKPYILYVGRRSKYKNFERFVQAFALLHEHFPEIGLVCTSTPFTKKEIELFKKLDIEADTVTSVSANECDMLRLYRDATCFVYPSLYEGFGMPILEAWSCRCPVVLSRASCFPEICGEGGLYFNPDSEEEMAARIEEAISNSTLRNQLINKGQKRLRLFSWQRCADQHMEIYKSLL